MSRARNIKPGFFKNDVLAECSPLAHILFAGLWCEADREGRLEDRPKRIKAEYLPYDDCDVDALLNELAAHSFIVRYSHGDQRFIAVLNFAKHQNPHVREPDSSIPAPDEHSASTVRGEAGHSSGPADSPSLIPDSPSPLSPSKPTASAARPKSNRADRFPEFWTVYPVKKGRAIAEAKWRARGYDAIADRIIEDVKRRIASDRQWLDGYAPHGSTYINGRGWEDEIEPARSSAAETPSYAVGAL